MPLLGKQETISPSDYRVSLPKMLELHGKQATLFVMTVVFLIISVVVVSLRCIARWKIRAFGWDDYFMFAGTVRAPFSATKSSLLNAGTGDLSRDLRHHACWLYRRSGSQGCGTDSH